MPSSEQFDAVCYIKRYPDLQDTSKLPVREGLPWYEQKGWMFKSADGTWHYGRTTNRDLKRIEDDPFWHWQHFGKNEGRVPGCDLLPVYYSPEFDAVAYRNRYPDIVPNTGPNKFNPYSTPLQHYQNIGIREHRVPGYEIVYPDSPVGLVSPGTVKYQTIEKSMEEQKEFEEQHKSPGSGEIITPPGSGEDMDNNKKWIWLAAAAVGAYFVFKNKRYE